MYSLNILPQGAAALRASTKRHRGSLYSTATARLLSELEPISNVYLNGEYSKREIARMFHNRRTVAISRTDHDVMILIPKLRNAFRSPITIRAPLELNAHPPQREDYSHGLAVSRPAPTPAVSCSSSTSAALLAGMATAPPKLFPRGFHPPKHQAGTAPDPATVRNVFLIPFANNGPCAVIDVLLNPETVNVLLEPETERGTQLFVFLFPIFLDR